MYTTIYELHKIPPILCRSAMVYTLVNIWIIGISVHNGTLDNISKLFFYSALEKVSVGFMVGFCSFTKFSCLCYCNKAEKNMGLQ